MRPTGGGTQGRHSRYMPLGPVGGAPMRISANAMRAPAPRSRPTVLLPVLAAIAAPTSHRPMPRFSFVRRGPADRAGNARRGDLLLARVSMFDNLSRNLTKAIEKLGPDAKLTPENVKEPLR